MQVQVRKLADVFQTNIQFQAPAYQRPYVWTKERQWEPLWEDVRELAARLLSGVDEPTEPHFLGAVVVSQEPTRTAAVERRLVIDGQQRLTTLQILIRATRDVTSECGEPSDVHRLEELISNNVQYLSGDDLFKVWPTTSDQNSFRAVMSGERASGSFQKALVFFDEAIREWIAETVGSTAVMRRLHTLCDVLREYLQMAVIDLGQGDNAHTIFETMNARGTELLAFDLVKNHLLSLAREMRLDQEALYSTYLEEFDASTWRHTTKIGQNSVAKVDRFLYYWVQMRERKVIRLGQIYRDYANSMKDISDPTDTLIEMQRLGRLFESVASDGAGLESHRTFLDTWRMVQNHSFTPLVLMLLSEPDRSHGESADALFAMLASLLVRRMICGRPNTQYTRACSMLLQQFEGMSSEQYSATFRHWLLEGAGAQVVDVPQDAEVIYNLIHRRIYRRGAIQRVRGLLLAVEERLRASRPHAEMVALDNHQIEHILPKAWQNTGWPDPQLPANEPRYTESTDPMAVRQQLVDSLGNLTLVPREFNVELSNLPWPEKQSKLQQQGIRLLMNTELLDYSTFDDSAILRRGRVMAESICEIWPHPEDIQSSR